MNVSIGRRVLVGEHRGTVKFIGQVDGYEGEYIGIEWDDCQRGKHDGTVNGKRYFTISHPKGASLVRPSMVNLGNEICSEVARRYDDEDEKEESITLGSKTVEMVDLGKVSRVQKQLERLQVIVLIDQKVSHASTCNPPFNRCTELNLHGNLLSRWSDVMDCLQLTPNCKELILGGNLLERIEDESLLEGLRKAGKVQRLTLNKCKLDEKTVSNALTLFPALKDVYLVENQLRSFILPSFTPSLTLVDLECNSISSFHSLKALSTLESLTKLSIAVCGLDRIDLSPLMDNTGSVGFNNLHILNLKGNPISDWPSISELSRLPSLSTLLIDCDRFHSEYGMDQREVVIAKLPGLKFLERCELSVVERRSAELRFLNKYSAMDEEKRKKERHDKDLKRLEMIYGPPIMDNIKSKQLSIVKLVFTNNEKSLPSRSIPTTITVQKILDMGKKLFALKRSEDVTAQLDQNGFIIDLDNPLRQLSFYDPQNNDIIRIL